MTRLLHELTLLLADTRAAIARAAAYDAKHFLPERKQ